MHYAGWFWPQWFCCWALFGLACFAAGLFWPRRLCRWIALAAEMLERCWGDAGAMLEWCWNDAGTMLESCWNDADTMLAPCWNAAARMLAQRCNDAGTMLGRLERRWDDADAGAMQERCCSCHLKIVFASTDSHVCSLDRQDSALRRRSSNMWTGKTLLSVGGGDGGPIPASKQG